MLNVQKYLLENGLQSLKDNYGVITKEYDNLVVINYSQIDSPKNDPITDECRGLILSADFSKVLCRSFDRFYNLGEADQKIDNIEDYTILEKYDGCCEYNTKVETLEHGIMEIGEIVSNKINCHVKSYNLETNEIVYSNIIGFSEKSEINDWYELKFENGNIINLTGNHYVWADNLKCWRMVRDLDGTEDVIFEKYESYFSKI